MVDAAIAALAGPQYGVVARRQLASLGVGRGAIEHRLATRRLQRLHRGVYAFGHDRLRPEGILIAAVLAGGRGAVLSHRAAAAHWGLLQTARAAVDVTVEAKAGRAQARHRPARRAPPRPA